MEQDDSKVSVIEQLSYHLGNHLVGLAIWYTPRLPNGEFSTPPKYTCYSGTILSIGGNWNFLTAGHILQGIFEPIKNGESKVVESHYIDYFGSNKIDEHSIPFDLTNTKPFYLFDEQKGLDFGLLPINDYKALLLANGIIPITENNWKNQPDDLDKFILIGLPEMFTRSEQISEGKLVRIRGSVNVGSIAVHKICIGNEDQTKEFPEFIGKIADDGYIIEDITGMSGGPIFGFDAELKKYWIVAIQSSWDKTNRIIYGCQIPYMGYLLDTWTKRINPI